jgi:hypothetical protein
MRKEEMAQVMWDKIKQQNADLLGTSEPVIQAADLGPSKGVYYRLRIGPFRSNQSANGLCSELKERQVACVIMRNENGVNETLRVATGAPVAKRLEQP